VSEEMACGPTKGMTSHLILIIVFALESFSCKCASIWTSYT